MKSWISVLLTLSFWVSACDADEPAEVGHRENVPTEDVVAHDPVIIKEGETYYLFTTGPGVSVWNSHDMEYWSMQEPVFKTVPDWTYEKVSGFNGHMWAPDISYHDGVYYLYYSVSSFGKNDSCIGLATNRTLDPESDDYSWEDHGVVVRSEPGLQDWNAIDPNLVFDEDGEPFLSFGSFWSGLKLAKLSEDLDHLADPEEAPLPIASRVQVPAKNVKPGEFSLRAGNTAIEGPFIYPKNGYFYLFASTDYCCRGKDSTYKMVVGRAKQVEGPYIDRDGVKMLEGGGTILLEGDERWQGVGHNAVCEIDKTELIIFHGYDGSTERGLPKLHIRKLDWTEDGWPQIGEPL